MWPEWSLFFCGTWIACSPWIFPHSENVMVYVVNIGLGVLLGALSLLSTTAKWKHSRYAITGISILLIVGDYIFFEHPRSPLIQNQIFVALVLVMLSILPYKCMVPPKTS